MTINDILSLDVDDIMRMSKAELLAVNRQMLNVTNKRIRNINKAGLNTPALERYQQNGAVKNLSKKSLNKLRGDYKKLKTFLDWKTSTVKGYKSYVKNVKKATGFKGSVEEFEAYNADLWSIFSKILELYPYKFENKTVGSEVRKEITAQMEAHPNENDEQIMNRVTKKLWGLTTEIEDKQKKEVDSMEFSVLAEDDPDDLYPEF